MANYEALGLAIRHDECSGGAQERDPRSAEL
jgi:hypothetical protein